MRNPVIDSDFPDPDIIRVGDIYYMASTTMYFMPGADILRSWDLAHWELIGHAYDCLETSDAHELRNGQHIYGQGMWAPSLTWHKGIFYLTFSCNDTHHSILFTATDPSGPWVRTDIPYFFHDSSLFFDDDDRVYIVYGNTDLHLTELDPKTWTPKVNGLDRVVISDLPGQPLGYEGSHLYKLNGKYYLFTCHMPSRTGGFKTEACFVADALDSQFHGRDIICDDLQYTRHLGVAQGGMVDDPNGNWYMFMFHDRGALGRAPVLMPMRLADDGLPTPATADGRVPLLFTGTGASAPHDLTPLNGNSFTSDGKTLSLWWQFSHNPDDTHWSLMSHGSVLRITTNQCASNLLQARNVLTQRCVGPICAVEVTVDATNLNNGDYAGLCAFTSHYGAIALHKENDTLSMVSLIAEPDSPSIVGDKDFFTRYPKIRHIVPVIQGKARLKIRTDFSGSTDFYTLYYWDGLSWIQIGDPHPMYFKLDLFTGCRFGLFVYATQLPGGYADFSDFGFLLNDEVNV